MNSIKGGSEKAWGKKEAGSPGTEAGGLSPLSDAAARC